MKKSVLSLMALTFVLLVSGCSSKEAEDISTNSDISVESVVSNVDLVDEFRTCMCTEVLHYTDISWDDTHNVRITIINTSKDIINYAPEYYYAYFKSPDEVHYVVNNGLYTVTKITQSGSKLTLNIREFDIHDGYNLDDFSRGEWLGDFMTDLDTGVTEEIDY